MSNASDYRAEAQRCRDLAAQSVAGSGMADPWRTLAAEYDKLADERDRPFRSASQTQQQPMQQQQQKATEDEK
jgi:hypothetical protein